MPYRMAAPSLFCGTQPEVKGSRGMKLRLTVLRERNGWSKAELCRRCVVGPPTLSLLESRQLRLKPESVVLRHLAHALEWKGAPSALLEEVGENG